MSDQATEQPPQLLEWSTSTLPWSKLSKMEKSLVACSMEIARLWPDFSFGLDDVLQTMSKHRTLPTHARESMNQTLRNIEHKTLEYAQTNAGAWILRRTTGSGRGHKATFNWTKTA